MQMWTAWKIKNQKRGLRSGTGGPHAGKPERAAGRRGQFLQMFCSPSNAAAFPAAARLLAFFLAFFLVLLQPSETVQAQPALDLNAQVSLTLQYKKDGKAIEGAAFRLYRAASVSQELVFSPEGKFAEYTVDWAPSESSQWKSLAETLAGYVRRDKPEPVREGKTGADGLLSFAGDDLKPGLYLVLGDRRTIGRYTYTPEPFLISLPSYGEENAWDYAPTVVPKSSSSYKPGGGGGGDPDPGTLSRRVLKVWNDGNSAARPKEVTVQLLRNGDVYATAKLNETNGWSFSWNGLPRGDVWEIVEAEVPEGYYVSSSLEGVTQVITNTKGDRPPTPDTPGTPNNPGNPGEPVTPITPPELGFPPEPEIPEMGTAVVPMAAAGLPEAKALRGKLPQTGVLWYPVPILAAAGLLFFAVGWYQERKRNDRNE